MQIPAKPLSSMGGKIHMLYSSASRPSSWHLVMLDQLDRTCHTITAELSTRSCPVLWLPRLDERCLERVKCLMEEATSMENLSNMYEGWMAWI